MTEAPAAPSARRSAVNDGRNRDGRGRDDGQLFSGRRRSRLFVAMVIAVVIGVAGLWWVGRGQPRSTAADREAITAAVAHADGDPQKALDEVEKLVEDQDRWRRLVTDGGDEVKTLLDVGLPALAVGDLDLAAAVIDPVLDGQGSDQTVPALGRWAWPFAARPNTPRFRGLATGIGSDGSSGLTDAVMLAQTWVASSGDADEARRWRREFDLAASEAGQSGPMLRRTGEVTVPGSVAVGFLAARAAEAGPGSEGLAAAWREASGATGAGGVDPVGRQMVRLSAARGVVSRDGGANAGPADALSAAVLEGESAAGAVHAAEAALLADPSLRATEAEAEGIRQALTR